jgi:hypothetical protein
MTALPSQQRGTLKRREDRETVRDIARRHKASPRTISGPAR